MIELRDNTLHISFPEVHPEARCTIDFQRTLRIPDDNREYPLPPGLGCFPLLHVDDYATRLPADWQRRGGAFLPIHQAEAMWLNFDGDYPIALKVAAGKINAVTGAPWSDTLGDEPQDYVVVPEQPWLDGFCVAEGRVRQFVAMPLGADYTAEEQITDAAEHGGLQIVAYPLRAEAYERLRLGRNAALPATEDALELDMCMSAMGLAPGGLMRQKIYDDLHGIDAFDTSLRARCFMHLLNSRQFRAVTGHPPPTMPPSARTYDEAGLPWFELYDDDLEAVAGADSLAQLDSVAARSLKLGHGVLADNEAVREPKVRALRRRHEVRDGHF